MKKYIGFIGVVILNCMLITGLLVHAFTLDSVKDSENDNKKQYVYIEKTTVKEQKEINPEDRRQENVNKDSKNYTNNTHNYVEKTTTTKTTCCNDNKNNTINNNQNNAINNNKNYSNDSNNSNTNNSSNKNDNNNGYTVEYTNTSYCGFCGKQLNNNDGICEDCREIRSKLGE